MKSRTKPSRFLNEYHHLVGQETDEYDFRDFRWAKLERLRRAPWIAADAAHDEALLEDKSAGEIDTTAVAQEECLSRVPSPCPRLDATYVENKSLSYASNTHWPVEKNSHTAHPSTANTAASNIEFGADGSHYEDFLTECSGSWSPWNEFGVPGSIFIPGDLF